MKFVEETIRSRQNPTVKWAASLSQKKARDEEKRFLAEGEKLTFEAFSSGLSVDAVLIREDRFPQIRERLSPYLEDPMTRDTRVFSVGKEAFEKISTENSPQGVICVLKYLDFFQTFDIIYKDEKIAEPAALRFAQRLGGDRALALCSLRDPGNLGSVIRSAVAFGVDHLILTQDCADLYHPKTVRSAMGSLFRVKATVLPDAQSIIRALSAAGRRVLCAELRPGAVSIAEAGLSRLDVVMIGNEGHGIPAEASALADRSVFLPISPKTESLNAAVAAAIFMWEQSQG